MRTPSILSVAVLSLFASTSLASGQPTNVAPYSGEARAYLGGGDVPGQRWRGSRALARSHWTQGSYYVPRSYYPGSYYVRDSYYYGSRRTHDIPPALYHAGDPRFWQ